MLGFHTKLHEKKVTLIRMHELAVLDFDNPNGALIYRTTQAERVPICSNSTTEGIEIENASVYIPTSLKYILYKTIIYLSVLG